MNAEIIVMIINIVALILNMVFFAYQYGKLTQRVSNLENIIAEFKGDIKYLKERYQMLYLNVEKRKGTSNV